MEGFRQHGDSEVAKIMPFAYKRLTSTKQPFWNFQPISSSKLYILLSRNLMEGFMQHRGSETA